jgi:two-component system chemotaxis sensor kinase CheA
LFQDVHSLKGISAIAGLGEAEALAHATEDLLRLMKSGQVVPSVAGWEALMSATRKLERIAAAFRAGEAIPVFDEELAELRACCEIVAAVAAVARPAEKDLAEKIAEYNSRGMFVWKYVFTPSRELNERGVNIGSVRAKLEEDGEIIKCTPIVKGPGAICFKMWVAAKKAPSDLGEWETMGVSVEPPEAESARPEMGSGEASPRLGNEIHSPFLSPSHLVRVDIKRLDDLMRITGEIVIQRSRLDVQLGALSRARRDVDLGGAQEVNAGLGRALRDLREAVMRIRLVPVAEIFARMPFVVRDLARHGEKRVRLEIRGQETAIDKYLIEKLKDPLLHLVRNAFTHGVETPRARLAASKPEEATITLRASTSGDSVIITVEDDGGGVNHAALERKAKELGLEAPAPGDNDALLKILCRSGFTTKEAADRAAGRGVGMAVVQAAVREMGGALGLESEEGRGTRFTLRLPLTLAIADAIIVTAAGQTCAVPQSYVREILLTSEEEIQTVDGVEVLPYRSGVLPVVRLAGLFRLRSGPRASIRAVVIATDRGSVGLLTDEVLGQREVVVRTLRDPLTQVRGVAGATELGDGKPVLILDGPSLTRGNVRPPEEDNLEGATLQLQARH